MNNFIFFAHTYWELMWMRNVIKAVDGQVFTDSESTREVAKQLKMNVVDGAEDYKALITCVYHMGQNRDYIERFLNTGRVVILMQHAWDTQIHILDKFWDKVTDRFTFAFVGSKQDEAWIAGKHGLDKVMYSGFPRFDDLYKVAKEKKNYDDIYKELGVDRYLLSITCDGGVHGSNAENSYLTQLPTETNIPIVYKLHPGGKYTETLLQLQQRNSNIIFVDDDMYDRYKTYRLIKASSGVVCIESFMAIEATMLGKPVIFYKHDSLGDNFFAREENVFQHERLPLDMSSTFSDLKFTERQKEVASWYKFDGQSTKRVVQLLTEINNDL